MQIKHSRPKGSPLSALPLGLFILGLTSVLASILIWSMVQSVHPKKTVPDGMDHFGHGGTMEPKTMSRSGHPLPGIPSTAVEQCLRALGPKG